MPDETSPSTHVTLRLPHDVVEAFDKLAAVLERPRSWVMLRALRHYLKAEGAEVREDVEAIAELDRGRSVPAQQVLTDVDDIIGRRRSPRARKR